MGTPRRRIDMEQTSLQKVFRIIEPVLDTMAFLAIKYILLCCSYAFRIDPLGSLIFNSIDFFVYCRYYFILRKLIFSEKKNIIAIELLFAVAIWLISSVGIYFFVMQFGYLEIASILKEVQK